MRSRGHSVVGALLSRFYFSPETEKNRGTRALSGRATADELVQDVVAGYFDELAQTREMLIDRYDNLKSGGVKPISGEEIVAHFREKSAAALSVPRQPLLR
jgi:hypothetical protein